jgi:hypothetical protein
MGDKQVLQRGNLVSIDRKGNKTTTPLSDGDVDDQIAKNKKGFFAGAMDAAESATVGRMQALPNRRDKVIDDADPSSTKYKRGGRVSSSGGFRPMNTTMQRKGR